MITVIEDVQDVRLDPFRDIKERTWVRDRGLFLAEGAEILRTLIHRARFAVVSVLVNSRQRERLEIELGQLAPSVTVFEVSRETMTAVVGYDLHRGVLALGSTDSADEEDAWQAAASDPGRIVLLEGLNNHDNVGGIFRSVTAFGAQAVLLSDDTADPLYRRAIRVSMGGTLVVPFARLGPDPFARVRSLGYQIWALTPGPDAEPLQMQSKLPTRLALAVGTEGPGLSEAWLKQADRRVAITMAAGHDSLNAATAASIALFATRPR